MGGGDQCLPVLCGTAEADLLGAVLGLILTAVLGIVYLVGEFTRNQDQ